MKANSLLRLKLRIFTSLFVMVSMSMHQVTLNRYSRRLKALRLLPNLQTVYGGLRTGYLPSRWVKMNRRCNSPCKN